MIISVYPPAAAACYNSAQANTKFIVQHDFIRSVFERLKYLNVSIPDLTQLGDTFVTVGHDVFPVKSHVVW